EPSLLMEPAITNGLSSDVDLTLQQFKDMGWFGSPPPCGATSTMLAFFEAEGRDDGILLRWQFSDPDAAGTVTVERAGTSSGPWGAIALERGGEDTAPSALDAGAEPGTEYFYRLARVDEFGATTYVGQASGRRNALAAAGVTLGAPRPNPAMHGATVSFRTDQPGFVRLSVTDVAGRRVRTLHEGTLPSGEHTLTWDGRTDDLERAAPGVYLIALGTPAGMRTQRIVVLR
ncbi:MAG: FlgD immunoglobulin-like domain containing protein, partial [Candidatus Eisenbacteria bacterium]